MVVVVQEEEGAPGNRGREVAAAAAESASPAAARPHLLQLHPTAQVKTGPEKNTRVIFSLVSSLKVSIIDKLI